MTTGSNGNYAPINGINLYFEKFGEGEPLILLHGGLGSIGMVEEVLKALAAGRQVIGVDLHGHGRTAIGGRPLSLEGMGKDVGELIKYLGLAQADVMGYSMGGGAALQVAIQYPERVRKLIVVSSPHKRSGWFPEMQTGMASMNATMAEEAKQSPMYMVYSQIAPRVEDWPELLDQIGIMLGKDYDWTNEVATFKMPVMIVVGDADGIRPSSTVEFFELLGGGQRDAGWDGSGMSNARLAILPGVTHYNIFNTPALVSAVVPFLDASVAVR
ncbi:MAG: alpha/beta hydrolase [Chloroflexi bacterium]|nr:alpha/beta hydrolase [Chloroflexota bacterium]OJV88727.1 MAG: alpha/beta hydrolase [Chloroflexi bacterium 54-19]